MVTLEWEQGIQRVLLVEFKWRAGLSSTNQLQCQWRDFLSLEERDAALHLFIAPDISAGILARQQDDAWNDRLILCSWLQVLNSLNRLHGYEKHGLGKWAKQVKQVLRLLAVHPFEGFANLQGPDISTSASSSVFLKMP